MELTIIIILLIVGFFIKCRDKSIEVEAIRETNKLLYDRLYEISEEMQRANKSLEFACRQLCQLNNKKRSDGSEYDDYADDDGSDNLFNDD